VTQIVPLESLNVGEAGRVCDIWGDHNLVTRLREMGLGEGAQLRMIQPGRPCLVAVDHQRLSFRVEEELVVLVEVQSQAARVSV